MLLSLPAQSTLGIVKDVEAGLCYFKHEKDTAPLYAVKGSGLRALCISDFPMPALIDGIPSPMEEASPADENRHELNMRRAQKPQNGDKTARIAKERRRKRSSSRGRSPPGKRGYLSFLH